MNKAIDLMLDLSEDNRVIKSELTFWILYYLICLIISIWIGTQFGYTFVDSEFSFGTMINLFANLEILVPLVLIVFTVIISKSIVTLLVNFVSAILLKIRRKLTKYEDSDCSEIKVDGIIDKKNKPTKKLGTFLSERKPNQIKQFSTLLLSCSYFIFAFWFTYEFVVYDRFTNLYHILISIILFLFFLVIVFISGMFLFMIRLDKIQVEELEELGLMPEKSNSQPQEPQS